MSICYGNKVVILGDSCSSGTDIHIKNNKYNEQYGRLTPTGLELAVQSDYECWQETDNTPGPRYAKYKRIESVYLACKGAKVNKVKNQFQYLIDLYPMDEQNNWEDLIIIFHCRWK